MSPAQFSSDSDDATFITGRQLSLTVANIALAEQLAKTVLIS